MAYADWTFYTTEYYGDQLTEQEFPKFAERATVYVYSYTQGVSERIINVAESIQAKRMVKMATCAVAEILQDEDTVTKRTFAKGQVIASETVGGHSRSFATGGMTQTDIDLIDKRKKEALLLYLGNLPEFEFLFRTRSYQCIHRTP